jgi:general transcription factor 3C polypeptide 3 (transcription factor C subunit 4)
MSEAVDPQLKLSEAEREDELYNDIDVGAIMGQREQQDEDEEAIIFSDDEMDVDGEDEVLAAFSDENEDWYEDEDEQDFVDAIREAKNFKRKKTSRSDKPSKKKYSALRPSKELDPEIRIILSEANENFVSRDYELAEKRFQEVIKKDPRNFPAYKSLGEIYLLQNKANKSCNAWFLAAHIKPTDGEFWAFVAKQSRDLGHTAQALYCLGRAISAGHRTYEVLLERAILYRETGQLGRASENLQKMLELFPQEAAVTRELALIYNQLNRVNDAIAMYLKVFERNVNHRKSLENGVEEEEPRFPEFDWSSLNILAELFVNQKNYSIAIRTIKHIARWIQERENEEFWEDAADDSEFDERRYENAKFEALPDILKNKPHKLPIDIRVKLGSLRLNLNYIDEALVHYKFLLNDDVSETADLFSEAAHKLEEAQLFSDAIKFYIPLSKLDEYQSAQLYTSLARCSTELAKYQEAKEYYNVALSMDPSNLDIMLSLVEVLYYLEEVEESQELLDKVNMLRKTSTGNEAVDETLIDQSQNEALIRNEFRVPKKGSRLTETEKLNRDARIRQNVIDKYKRLQRLYQGLEQDDPVAAGTWIQLASELIEIFCNVKNFFPRDRSRQFKGIIMRTKGLRMDIDSKIERISQLYEGFTSKMEEKIVLTSKQEFRGISYDQWFELFMQYALAVGRFDNAIDANSIIDNAKNINVFYQDRSREKMMNLVKLSISIRTDDSRDILTSIRNVVNMFQFNKELLKLFMLVQPSGKTCTENFISINHQKYFLRQLKAYDSLKLKKSIPGMANVVNKELDAQGSDNIYLMHIYACLLFTNRSYVPSLVYLTRMYKNNKEEPLICLLTGLAHVHRSMQRSSTNRHVELLQGLKHIMEYSDVRSSTKFGSLEHQEALYNVGRVYHMLGLFSIAVEFYNRVLDEFDDLDEEEDLKRHAAYNLVLIYNNSGNTRLSNKIMEKYLTI